MKNTNEWPRRVGTRWMIDGCSPLILVIFGVVLMLNTSRLETQQPDLSTQQKAKAVTLVVQDSSLGYIVQTLGKLAGRLVIFNGTDSAFAKRTSVRIVNVRVMDAFTTALQGTGLVAKFADDGRTIMVGPGGARPAKEREKQAHGVITGLVLDSATSQGIAKATVQVVGSEEIAITYENGGFTLYKTPTGRQQLSVRVFGYKTTTRVVEVPDSGQVTVRILLVPTVSVLSGVVTTATGTQDRRQVGQDITVLNVDSVMRVAPVSSVTELLETRVPGLAVLHSSGAPGAPVKLRLRGTSSLDRNNEPILIVDGVRVNDAKNRPLGDLGPNPLNQLDVNSIETIEVFKGPSAAAMYGADAGDGVIVVTMKRGRAGATRWNLSWDWGRTEMVGTWPTNFFRFGHDPSAGQASNICGFSLGCPFTDSLVEFQALNVPRLSPFGTGNSSGVSTTVSGGVGAMTYALTGSRTDELGVRRLPPVASDAFVTKHGTSAPDWMRKPDRNTTWGFTSRFGLPLGSGGGTVGLTSQLFNSERAGGGSGEIPDLRNRYVDTSFYPNVESLLTIPFYTRRVDKMSRYNQTVEVNVPIRPWFPFRLIGGVDVTTGERSGVLPRSYANDLDSVGRYDATRDKGMVKTLGASSTFRVPERGRRPGVTVPVGFNWTSLSQTSLSGSAIGLPAGVFVPSIVDNGGNQSQVSSATYGWFLAPILDLHSRFFVSPGIRLDGGNAIGSSVGFSPYPKVDFSWIALDRQGDRPLLGIFTLLRPRLAVGIAGVQPEPGDQIRTFVPLTRVPVGGGSGLTDVVLVNGQGNTRLRPERSREFEGGLDMDLWDSRVTLTVSAYHKLRYDAIIASPLAPSIGLSDGLSAFSNGIAFGQSMSLKTNIGDVRNRGIESSIGARLLDGQMVSWQLNAALSKNKNVLLRLAPGAQQANGGAEGEYNRNVPGFPLYGIWAKPIVGYADADGDGTIRSDEVRVADSAVYIGAQIPNFESNLSTTVGVWNGRLRLSTAVSYQNGLTQTNGSFYDLNRLNDPRLSLGERAALVAPTTYAQHQVVDVLRWQSVSIDVEMPITMARFVRASSMAIAVQGSNLGFHTNYRGKDPNVGVDAYGLLVRDAGVLPTPRLWQLRVTVRN